MPKQLGLFAFLLLLCLAVTVSADDDDSYCTFVLIQPTAFRTARTTTQPTNGTHANKSAGRTGTS